MLAPPMTLRWNRFEPQKKEMGTPLGLHFLTFNAVTQYQHCKVSSITHIDTQSL